jgi:chemotaxis protein MotB
MLPRKTKRSPNKSLQKFSATDRLAKAGDGDANAWAASYGDMVTLLLVFFIVLSTVSSTNPSKARKVQEAMRGESKEKEAHKPTPAQKITQDLKKIIQEQQLTNSIVVDEDAYGARIRIKNELLFASGEASLRAMAIEQMQQVLSYLKELPADYHFLIEGHTDDAPIKTNKFPSNWHLSSWRAISVLELIQEHISKKRLSVVGHADQHPLVPNHDEAGKIIHANRAKNRRVEIKIRDKMF